MTPKEFCERMIKEWQAKSREASENADLAAFELAEQELSNYTEMLKRYDTDITYKILAVYRHHRRRHRSCFLVGWKRKESLQKRP